MRSMNRVFLIGHVGREPDVRTLPSGQKVANFPLATNEVWRDASGQRQERTEWHRIVAFGRLAELSERYIRKGRYILVEGRIQSRQYTDAQGNVRYITEIIARDISFLEPRSAVTADVADTIEPPPVLDDVEYESVTSDTSAEDEELDFLI